MAPGPRKIDCDELGYPRVRISGQEELHAYTAAKCVPRELKLDGKLTDVDGLEYLESLEYLAIDEPIASLEGLSGLRHVERLWISSAQLRSLRGLEQLESAPSFSISRTGLTILEGLSGLRRQPRRERKRTSALAG